MKCIYPICPTYVNKQIGKEQFTYTAEYHVKKVKDGLLYLTENVIFKAMFWIGIKCMFCLLNKVFFCSYRTLHIKLNISMVGG